MESDISTTKTQAIIGGQFPKIVIPKIDEAKISIKIVVFDWRWYPNDMGNPCQLFNQSIVRAVGRGVRVSVVTNNSDILATLKEIGATAQKLITKNLVHAKLMIIDDKILILGSHNYTQSAFTMNYEVSILLDNPDNLGDFINYFKTLSHG
jgi:phosphatidylserine/phosphatidylglycerophosphate/cardiolipin synthase-like enzyme